jgi:hypothetical protein
VVSAELDDTPAGTDTGSAYVFGRSSGTWTEAQKVVPSDVAAGDEFGVSVAIDRKTVLAGTIQDDNAAGPDAGAAYAFALVGSTWAQQAKLLAPEGAPNDRFGVSVDVSGLVAVVGADMTDAPADGLDAGSAFVFTRTGTAWTERRTLRTSDLAPDDQFGRAVAIDAGMTMVGARTDGTSAGAQAGSLYAFPRPAISSFAPHSGTAGTAVALVGVGFTDAATVTFGGVEAVFTVVGDRRIEATVPNGATTGPIRVTGPLGAGVSTSNFVVQP